MQQAHALAGVARLARTRRDLNIITFSGYYYEELLAQPAGTGIPELLAETDVLIDGPYVKSMNDNRGLRGSNNQRILHLTSRLKGLDFENYPRRVEIQLRDSEAHLIGIPANGVLDSLGEALRAPAVKETINHERI